MAGTGRGGDGPGVWQPGCPGESYEVTASDGTPIGLFRKDFAKSLARSTWHLEQPGLGTATGCERSMGIALTRRA
jgi:hypothetical protein